MLQGVKITASGCARRCTNIPGRQLISWRAHGKGGSSENHSQYIFHKNYEGCEHTYNKSVAIPLWRQEDLEAPDLSSPPSVPPVGQGSLEGEGQWHLTCQEQSLGDQLCELQAVEGQYVVKDDGPEIHRPKSRPNPPRHGC